MENYTFVVLLTTAFLYNSEHFMIFQCSKNFKTSVLQHGTLIQDAPFDIRLIGPLGHKLGCEFQGYFLINYLQMRCIPNVCSFN